jgi:hypothetical protein
LPGFVEFCTLGGGATVNDHSVPCASIVDAGIDRHSGVAEFSSIAAVSKPALCELIVSEIAFIFHVEPLHCIVVAFV